MRLVRDDGQRPPRWTCRTHVAKVVDAGGELEIAPLANLPVIKDLATDMTRVLRQVGATPRASFEGGRRAATRSRGRAGRRPQRAAADAGIECIGCGVCYASCDVVAWHPDYLGPAALNRAWTLVNDVRDVRQRRAAARRVGRRRLPRSATRRALHRACPKHIAPTYAIAGLKRARVRGGGTVGR